ncbi:hypothetical protein Q3G72_025110 [Acer saccharum]|nr:hypothetical protein Q3G72_025110 [Acer saccharum]
MLLCCHNFLLLCRVSDFLDRLSCVDSVFQKDITWHFIVCVWLVWRFRNGHLFGRKRLLDVVLWARAAAFLGELDGVRDAVNGSRSADEVRQVWRPPLAAGFKLNVDAAVDGARGAVGIGKWAGWAVSHGVNLLWYSVFWVIDGWFRAVSVVVELMMGVGNELMMVMN